MPPKKKDKSETQSISPYRAIQDWMLNPNITTPPEEWVVKALNPLSVLGMFGHLGKLTIYLNEQFNNFGLLESSKSLGMKPDLNKFYCFLKEIVQKHGITRYEFSYFKTEKADKELAEIQKHFPYLRRYEIQQLMESIKGTEYEDNFLETLGLKKYKKAKVTKAELKKVEESLKVKEPKDESISFENWASFFK